jgi:glycosyltransferase involved in cell wall biosynthesis
MVLIGPSPTRPGGIATFVRFALASDLGEPVELVPDDKPLGIGPRSPLPFRLAGGVSVVGRLARRLRRGDRPGVHVCCGSGASLLQAGVLVGCAHAAGSRVVLHVHAASLEARTARSRSERKLARAVLRRPDGIVALSQHDAASLVALGAPADRVVVVPNAVDCSATPSPHPRAAGRAGPLRAVMLGAVERRKGIDVMLAAVARLGGRVSVDVHGPEREDADTLRAWRTAASAAGVTFHGAAPHGQVDALLAASDLLLLPSRREGVPFAMLEAMASARPVLASDLPSLRETLGGGGAFVPVDDPGALAAALAAWAEAAEQLPAIGLAGWARARDAFAASRSAAALRALWARVNR